MTKALILLFTQATLITSCGVKKTAMPDVPDLNYSAYSSCYAGLNDRSTPRASGVVDSGYFGKLIDRRDLNELLGDDIRSSASHATRESLSLYVVNSSADGGCSSFSFLPIPSTHLYDYWRQAAGGAGVGSLLGLYKEDCGDGCRADRVINPLVMLNACTDRWTMVHEMTHHNFNVQRKRYRPLDADENVIVSLQNEMNILNEVTSAFNTAPTDYLGMQVVHSLDNVRDLMIRFVYQTSFEEVTIESMLMREFANGSLMNVPADSVNNAISYIRYSIADGINRVSPIKSATESLESVARQNGWDRVLMNARILKAKLNTFEDDSMCYQDEAVSLYQQATVAGTFPGDDGDWGDATWSRIDQNKKNNFIKSQVEAHSRNPKMEPLEEQLKEIASSLKPH